MTWPSSFKFKCDGRPSRGGTADSEELPRGGWIAVVTEIPYGVQKSRLIEKLAELIAERKLPLVADVRDESAEDVRITRQLVDAGRVMGISVLDHIVLGRPAQDRAKDYLSLREEGLVSFNPN